MPPPPIKVIRGKTTHVFLFILKRLILRQFIVLDDRNPRLVGQVPKEAPPAPGKQRKNLPGPDSHNNT